MSVYEVLKKFVLWRYVKRVDGSGFIQGAFLRLNSVFNGIYGFVPYNFFKSPY